MIAAAASSSQMPLAAWVSILVGVAGIAVLLLKAGQRFGAMEEHLKSQDGALSRQDDELAALHQKLDDLGGPRA